MGRQMTWAKDRNMAIQLFSLWDPNFGNNLMAWVFPLSFCMPLLIPFMFLHTIQDLKEKIKRFIRCQFHTAIMPLTVTVPQQIAMTNRRRRDL
ncbi:unnamed protein product [Adineta steineri]|uniref:Uncharacterized protein n=1 Tax=Adineta steineri TaxID=433720 RepID=A0A814PN09_9BILA|nr:unnamed protein product [Adineta steineri]CAF1108386.1 unnamed protein product [Adineta steineri]